MIFFYTIKTLVTIRHCNENCHCLNHYGPQIIYKICVSVLLHVWCLSYGTCRVPKCCLSKQFYSNCTYNFFLSPVMYRCINGKVMKFTILKFVYEGSEKTYPWIIFPWKTLTPKKFPPLGNLLSGKLPLRNFLSDNFSRLISH